MRRVYPLFLSGLVLFLYVCAPNMGVASPNASDDLVVALFKLAHPLPEVPEKMMVHRVVDPGISREDIVPLMEVFGLQGKIVVHDREFVVRDRDRALEVFKQPGTGYLRFSDDAKLAAEEQARDLPSEDEAVAMAEEFLRSNGLLPENTFLAGTGYYEFTKYDAEGKIFEQGRSAISVGFGFTIEGVEVHGPGAKAGVVFGEGGKMIGASRIWREIRPDREVRVIPPEWALTRFKQRWPREADPDQFWRAKIRTEVRINEMYLSYYAKPGCIPQSYIEPVYVFKGVYQVTGITGDQEIMDGDTFDFFVPAAIEE